jgi:hypothetical protein
VNRIDRPGTAEETRDSWVELGRLPIAVTQAGCAVLRASDITVQTSARGTGVRIPVGRGFAGRIAAKRKLIQPTRDTIRSGRGDPMLARATYPC